MKSSRIDEAYLEGGGALGPEAAHHRQVRGLDEGVRGLRHIITSTKRKNAGTSAS